MKNYIGYLEGIYSPETSRRKIDYLNYNFLPYLQKLNNKSNILEIGPGLGELLNILNTQRITNIDIVDNAKDVLKYNKLHYHLNKAFLSSGLKTLDKNLGEYQIIFLIQVLEHLSPDRYKDYIQILYKHLKPQGFIIITVPNGANPLGFSERYNDLQHKASFTEISLKELPSYCEISNYEVEIKGYRIPPYNLLNIFRIFAQKIFYGLVSFLYLVNAGVYLKIYNPNITLIIKKLK